MDVLVNHTYEFGPFRLEVERHRLLRDGEVLAVPPRALDALLMLVQRRWQMVRRQDLMEAIWVDTFVEDSNLTVAVSQLRKALGENERARYIETIPRVGYRFVGDVREVIEEPGPLIVEKRTQSRTVIAEEIEPDVSPPSADPLTIVAPSRLKIVLPNLTPRRGFVAVAAAIVVSLGSLIYFQRTAQNAATSGTFAAAGIRSLAVLPPKPIGPESESASVSLGIADSLITRLGAIHNLSVRPTSAVARYVDQNEDPLSTARGLKVDAVLDGTIQHDHGRTRITLRLLNTTNGNQLWAGNFDEADADIFKLQDSISQRVAEALSPNLTKDQREQLVRRQTTNKEAYALYVKGNYFWNKRGPEAARSKEYLRRAVELDPNFAQAYATLAAVDAATSAIPSPEAEALVDKALQLDDSLAEAHATLGFIRMFHHWDWPTAEKELNRAVELDPNSAVAHHWKGVYLSIVGRSDEAKAEMHRALDLDPLSLIIMADIGQLHYFAHEYDQALDYCNRALALDPDFWTAHEYLLDIYHAKGMNQESLEELLKLDYRESTPEVRQHVEEMYARGGINAVFAEQLNSYLKDPNNERRSIIIAKWYSRLGDYQRALYWLNQAASANSSFWTAYMKVEPLYEPLHNDRRFSQIVNRMGLGLSS